MFNIKRSCVISVGLKTKLLSFVILSKYTFKEILTRTYRTCVSFEDFMTIECSDVFYDDHVCENGATVQRFGECLSPLSG